MNTYKTEATTQLAADIKAAGYRVFIAKRGTYGFYTDAEGSRVVSFQFDLGGFKFSGNYKSKTCGTGWQLEDGSFEGMFNQNAPQWAVCGADVKYTTLDQHLATYQQSSQYVEV